ncbi:MAG: hypothetical protein M3246_09360 [Actinomycetota bacterium]|nr:hypothetical protein [Actinomycetota bacterium]
MKIVERIPAHYEVEEVRDLGRSYKWCPEQVVLECGECTKRMTFTRSQLVTSVATCGGCGARSTASVREELLVELRTEDEAAHPWRYWRARGEAGIPV